MLRWQHRASVPALGAWVQRQSGTRAQGAAGARQVYRWGGVGLAGAGSGEKFKWAQAFQAVTSWEQLG